jgi:hypothetical protein
MAAATDAVAFAILVRPEAEVGACFIIRDHNEQVVNNRACK